MARCLLYLQTCLQFDLPEAHLPSPQKPPEMQPLPTSGRLLSTYTRETFDRMEELKAGVTSIFGSILKMNSVRVMKTLPGADSGMAQRRSSLANELVQVLIYVLTPATGCVLQDMAKGLQDR
ncbi:hypothetical protein CHARACLAT_007114 [Characodon lateralis]|uniref:Uncharacterized protein n=1 Tax=Characodon lateralis TaxID=208331 RepID=A0ABU7ERL0_9TELE|nr:hypothetical protein [Characodon lateralis]